MSKKYSVAVTLLLVLVLAACASPTPIQAPVQPPTQFPATAEPTAAPARAEVPHLEVFKTSGHADATALAFNDWNDAAPPEVPAACARCHTSAGFNELLATGKVAKGIPAPAGAFTCATCHNPVASAVVSVTFPSGQVINTGEEGEALCMTCHQGRQSKVSVDRQIANFKVTDADTVVAPIKDANGNDVLFNFLNVHYFAAGGTLYGAQAQMGYEYDGQLYDPKFRHVAEMDTCVACHDQHATQVRVEKCAECHTNVKTVDDLQNVRMQGSLVDYNGNGNVQEGIAAEIKGLQDTLYASIQAYATEVTKTPIVYDEAANPYFFVAAADGKPATDDKGAAVRYNAFTARLLKATYNYQVSVKDPGAFAHNGKYIIELLYDSIADLNGQIAKPVDLTKLHRDDAGHFAGNTLPFRDWDAEGEVPFRCAKCHTAEGLPTFIKSGGTVIVTANGTTYNIGTGPIEPSTGLACATCHDTSKFPARLAVTSVPFPSGAQLTFSTEKDDQGALKPVDANLCLECHQGRESTLSVNNYLKAFAAADQPDPKISFKNIHYFAAGATLFGNAAQGAYQYDGQKYSGQNLEHPLNQCIDCHAAHALTVQVDQCAACHTTVKAAADLANIRKSTVDYNGNGDAQEGIAQEVAGFQAALYAEIQQYAEAKAGTPILYDADTNPYFFVDKDKDGKIDQDDKGAALRYNAWMPRLLKAAYNYQASIKDPGGFAHNPMYVMQYLYDSIKDLGGNVGKLVRPEVEEAEK